MSITLTDQNKTTLRTAAYGAVSLMAAADATGSPHKAATNGSAALYTTNRDGRTDVGIHDNQLAPPLFSVTIYQ
ncbi:hypothetical protein OG874_17170 [Nocardia sp. NBC_00565]|uniref:hypothetical protein n=1 Tax=Nocardia sp. NBC_00565 TaxID=2975993 RepID=UPI002E81CA0E|nr:hypothetical protein [Nocardia sp. NBC_00565]WUC06742.1 hypothetical protein OG874_17170 [Nocardia sp. NBC_00565]